MPYIPEATRDEMDSRLADTPGELNYMFTEICNEYLARKGLRYYTVNEVVGALECAKLELYRRVASPYEDKAIDRNGDVYSAALL